MKYVDQNGLQIVVSSLKNYVDTHSNTNIASKTTPGAVWMFSENGKTYIWNVDPMQVQLQQSTSAGGINYDIKTMNYISETNLSGGLTITIGEGEE